MNFGELIFFNISTETSGHDARASADFVGDVVATSSEEFLIEEGDFEGAVGVALEGRSDVFKSQIWGGYINSQLIEFLLSFGRLVMVHVTEATRVIVDESFVFCF